MIRKLVPLFAAVHYGDSTRGYSNMVVEIRGRAIKYLERNGRPASARNMIGLGIGDHTNVSVVTPSGDCLPARVRIGATAVKVAGEWIVPAP